jgi:hypothetical protein
MRVFVAGAIAGRKDSFVDVNEIEWIEARSMASAFYLSSR